MNSFLCDAIDRINVDQKFALIPDIIKHFTEDLSDRKFAVWGLAFKPKTDDVREAPALYIIEELLRRGATVAAYDPEAINSTRKELGDRIDYANDAYDALTDADALIICTEWNEFRSPDFDHIKDLLKNPLIFDGRNLYDINIIKNTGFHYISIGRPDIN